MFGAVRHADADAICGFICISVLYMDAPAHVPVSICFPEKEIKKYVFTGCSFMQEECALITGCWRLCCVQSGLTVVLKGMAEISYVSSMS